MGSEMCIRDRDYMTFNVSEFEGHGFPIMGYANMIYVKIISKSLSKHKAYWMKNQ